MKFLDIVIPATTEVVGRGPGLAAYLKGLAALAGENFSLIRTGDGVVTVDVDETHGLSVGDQIFIDGVLPTGEVPATDSGTPSGNFASPNDSQAGTTVASIHSTNSQAGTYEGVFSRAIRNPEGRLLILGGATTPDGLTFTPKDNFTVLEVTGETVSGSGGRAVDYLWTQIAPDGTHGFNLPNFGYRGFGVSLLTDGRVLCTGGAVGDDLTGTPVGGWDMLTFLPPDSVSQQQGSFDPRVAHGQCSLADGGALVSGGWAVAGTPLDTSARFDVTTENWASDAVMKVSRMHHELVALDDGIHVLAIGGQKSASVMINRCEIWNGSTWELTGNMTYARTEFGVLKLPDGRVLVVGGRGYNPSRAHSPGTLSSCEIYDPKTGLWSTITSMRSGREHPAIAYLPTENAVYVTGGSNGVFSVEVLDLDTMRWRTSMAQIQTPHLDPTGGLVGTDVFAMVGGWDHAIATEKTNQIIVPGEDRVWEGAGINGTHRVAEVPDGTHIIVHTREYDYGHSYTVASAGASVTPMRAEAAPSTVPGPFSYDVKTGFAITAVAGTTDTAFNRGVHYSSVHLTGFDPALNFPDEEGWLVFNFGYQNMVGPIRYLGRLSDEDLILDAAVPFSATLPAGAAVRLLSGRVPFEPAADHLVGNFYVTGTAAGREAARQIINDIVAAGKQVLVTVLYPGDRGLGGEGFPQGGSYKLSDRVSVWGGDELDSEIPAARKGP
jgi:hypothetical protein